MHNCCLRLTPLRVPLLLCHCNNRRDKERASFSWRFHNFRRIGSDSVDSPPPSQFRCITGWTNFYSLSRFSGCASFAWRNLRQKLRRLLMWRFSHPGSAIKMRHSRREIMFYLCTIIVLSLYRLELNSFNAYKILFIVAYLRFSRIFQIQFILSRTTNVWLSINLAWAATVQVLMWRSSLPTAWNSDWFAWNSAL